MSTLLFAALTLTPAAPALKNKAPGIVDQIVGEWALEEWRMGEVTVSVAAGSSFTFLRNGQRHWFDGSTRDEDRTYALDTTTNPVSIKLTYGVSTAQPESVWAIVKIEGDRLIICHATGNGEKPKSFDVAGTNHTLMTMRRVAKK